MLMKKCTAQKHPVDYETTADAMPGSGTSSSSQNLPILAGLVVLPLLGFLPKFIFQVCLVLSWRLHLLRSNVMGCIVHKLLLPVVGFKKFPEKWSNREMDQKWGSWGMN